MTGDNGVVFNWDLEDCLAPENVSEIFVDCNTLDEIRQKARKYIRYFTSKMSEYKDDYGTPTRSEVRDLIHIINEIVEGVDKSDETVIFLLEEAKQRSQGDEKNGNQQQANTYINYAAYRQGFTLCHWSEFWDYELPYGQNILRLFTNFAVLPDAHIQFPIVAAFACQNTALMNISNILFLCSRKPGSGKSTIAECIAALQGELKVLASDKEGMSQGSDTFASVRNFINDSRFHKKTGGEFIIDPVRRERVEKNLCLVLDDFPEEKLKNEDYYNLLKAYKRQNAYIRKAERKKDEHGDMVDTTVTFHVFCCKVLTACYQIFGTAKYNELSRRCLFIRCQPLEEIKQPDPEAPEYIWESRFYHGLEIYKTFEINWNGIDQEYYKAWDVTSVEDYHLALKKLKKPKGVTSSQWEISKDLAASGFALGVWNSIEESLEGIKNYWEWFTNQKLDAKAPIELVCESAVADWLESCEFENSDYFDNGTKNPYFPMNPDMIDPGWIDLKLKQAARSSQLDINPTFKIRNEVMGNIGYKIRRIRGKNYYCPIG